MPLHNNRGYAMLLNSVPMTSPALVIRQLRAFVSRPFAIDHLAQLSRDRRATRRVGRIGKRKPNNSQESRADQPTGGTTEPVLLSTQCRRGDTNRLLQPPNATKRTTPITVCMRPILLKNSLPAARARVIPNGDPLERAQSDANCVGDDLLPPKVLRQEHARSFSTESAKSGQTYCCSEPTALTRGFTALSASATTE